MRKSNQQTIGEVLQQFLKENKLDTKLNQANIIGNWEKLVGPLFSNILNIFIFWFSFIPRN